MQHGRGRRQPCISTKCPDSTRAAAEDPHPPRFLVLWRPLGVRPGPLRIWAPQRPEASMSEFLLRTQGNKFEASIAGRDYWDIQNARGYISADALGILPSNTGSQNSDAI